MGTSEAAALAEAAYAAGTRVAFGLPGGGANLDLIAACSDVGIEFVLMRSESAAVFAAAAYADVRSAPGLAICTRGPGIVAAALGTASALLDRQPVIVATDGAGAEHPHQRVSHAALGAVVAKAVTADGAAAVRIAMTAPHGPVVFDFGGSESPPEASSPAPPATAGSAIRVSGSRPAIVVGGGARANAGALRRLVEGRRIPVLATYRAKGAIPDTWPNAAGLFTGFPREGLPLAHADAIITVGLDPVELLPAPWGWPTPALALVEAEPHDLAQIPAGRTVVGPLDRTLGRLELDDSGWSADGRSFQRAALDAIDVPVAGLAPQDVVRATRAALPSGSIATVDAGAHMLVAMGFWSVNDPSECLISSGLATMGFALPAAIGASFARDVPVVCFVGDGGLGMVLADLETLARTGRDVRVVVFNDASLSLIRIKQTGHRTDAVAVTHAPVDFAAAARALGIAAGTVTTAAELSLALEPAGPYLIDARIDASGYRAILAAVRGPIG